MGDYDLSPFLAKALDHPILSKEETAALVRRSQRGDKRATDRLVRHNLRFVALIAKKQAHKVSFEDLMQEGCLGLLKGIERFQLSSGNSLVTYAVFWIRAYVNKAVEDATGIRRPKPGRKFRDGRMAAEHVSLEAYAIDETGEKFDIDRIGLEDPGPSPFDHFEREETRRKVRRSLYASVTNSRDLAIVHRIMDPQSNILGSIGQKFGVSREAVRQWELRVRDRLMRNDKLRRIAEA
jgi:RNA polymerase sigma factor (sigma-70 family)